MRRSFILQAAQNAVLLPAEKRAWTFKGENRTLHLSHMCPGTELTSIGVMCFWMPELVQR